ncbi:MFS transporter [Streptomyces sp. NPDC059256]|uniref:MFS transporter n=1 Tax=Streptomyces sp. NPDC059256 TaxID=3346794 RepID=UPI0036C67C0E
MRVSTPAPAQVDGQALLARLERLPVSRPHHALLLMGGLGIAFDGMDGALLAYVLPAVTELWHLSSWQTGLLGSSLLIGIMIGALTAGLVGDKIGRRPVMMYALALYCGATAVAAFAPNWQFFFGARVVAGIGAGAEAAIIPAFMAEFVPSRVRGLFVGAIAGFFSFGYLGAALLGRFLIPGHEEGWRIAQLVTSAPVLMLLWWRTGLPESPRWLVQRGRMREADGVITELEARVEQATGRALPPVPPTYGFSAPPVRQMRSRTRLAALWRGGFARRTIVLWLLWICNTFAYYGFFIWMPSLLIERGMSMEQSFTSTLLITLAQIPGYYSAAFLSERLGRTRTIALYLAGGALSAGLLAQGGTEARILWCGALLSYFMNGSYAALYAYSTEVYPTAIRATGAGAASAFGRLGGITAPVAIGVLYPVVGFGGVFALVTGVLAAGATIALAFGLRTTGRTLEELGGSDPVDGCDGIRAEGVHSHP